MKKIFPYLIINIAVSAVTMLAVILIWNATHPAPPTEPVAYPPSGETSSVDASSLPPLSEKTVEIQTVFMPGERDYEKISLKNVSDEPVDLTGWSLSNDRNSDFTFPSLTLYPNGAVDVYSLAGVNTAVELFWNSDKAIWSAGGKAVLYDSANQVRSQFSIP